MARSQARSRRPFTWPVRVYHEDIDLGGIVYYANYLRFLERARTEWLRRHGCEQDVLRREANLMFVVANLSIDYIAPARFNDLLHVSVKIRRIRRASLELAQNIRRGDAELVSRGEVRIACVDTARLSPRPIPLSIVSELQRDH